MNMWSLGETEIGELTMLPESGMGFQLVEAVVWGRATPLLVLNSDRVIDLSEIALEPGEDSGVILRNGLRVVSVLKSKPVVTMMAEPKPHSFRLLQTRVGVLPAAGAQGGGRALLSALPSSLVKHVALTGSRIFYRFSAFNPDRRVNSNGDFLPGTYAAPESEVPFVPTGFLAVGRFALPNVLPASFRYEITAPPGTSVDFGTVAPAYGQAGGGVEAYFASSVMNAKKPPKPVVKMPDE